MNASYCRSRRADVEVDLIFTNVEVVERSGCRCRSRDTALPSLPAP